MITDDERQSREIAEVLDHTAARAMKMEPGGIISAFDAAAEILVSKGHLSRQSKLEAKRRVAEWKFKLLSERDLSFSEIRKLHRNVHDLGCSSLENEANIDIAFAQYCVRQCHYDEAKTALKGLRNKIDEAIITDDPEIYRHFIRMSEEILSQLNESSGS